MPKTDDTLPDDLATLKAMLLAERVRSERLVQIIKELQRHRFGRRAETLPEDQMLLALEDVEQSEAGAAAESEGKSSTDRERRARKRRMNRGSLPAHLPRVEVIVDLKDKACPCCKGLLHVIGGDVSERLDILPARFQVLVTRRPKYACRSCEEVVVQAPAPARLIEGGIPTEATVAHVLVSKYADHLPLYRQAQIYSRQGINLDRSTLATAWKMAYRRWLSTLAFDHPAQQIAFQDYVDAVTDAERRLKIVEEQILKLLPTWNLHPVVEALQAIRGIAHLTAIVLVADVGDFTRFANPRQLMAYFGLVPGERSSGETTYRSGITKTGNNRARRALVEGAWAYRMKPRVGRHKVDRIEALPKTVRDVAWKSQVRLCARYRRLSMRGKTANVVNVVIAREMVGFVWSIACLIQSAPKAA